LRERLREPVRSLRRRLLLAASGPEAPISGHWGADRGLPIDRWYIERFLDRHRDDIHGDVLEVKSDAYVRRFGSSLEEVHVLDLDPENPHATVVGDLAGDTPPLPEGAVDCFVLTQTLQYIWDLETAISNAHRMLRDGGSLLLTVPSVTRISHELDIDDFWRFTPASLRRLLAASFSDVDVAGAGNLVSAMAFLTGLAAHELAPRELGSDDFRYPVVVTARAVR
jgi:SAM-dependent methyltransferase